ncbi:MAG: UDP-3-O-acyl-N-acetylglucosamine deacetylase [Thermodesulfovibrionales bacterium]
MRLQRTIKQEVRFEGIGLHSGRPVRITLKPAPRDHGVTFFRKDRGVFIKASFQNVIDTAFATTIGVDGVRIRTVEHLLAALSGLCIDNILVEIEGPEVPAMDGSAISFIEYILKAGIVNQAKRASYLEVKRPFLYEEPGIRIMALPYSGRKFTYNLELPQGPLKKQSISIELNEETFLSHIAPARTFGFLKDVEYLRKNGLALGGSLSNAVVIDEERVLNAEGLRFPDEFARHKVLDMLGDLYLAGYQILGHIVSWKSGHSSNIKFLKKMLSSGSLKIITEETLKREEALPLKSLYFQ